MGGGRKGASSRDRHRGKPRHAKALYDSSNSDNDENCSLDLEAFAALLARSGLRIRDVESDGSCLFRAVSDQLYGDETHHRDLRAQCVQYMADNEDAFAPFVDDSRTFATYLDEMSQVGVWGGNLELQALSMALALDIRIHQVSAPSYDIRNSFEKTRKRTPIHLSYHLGQHYASVRRADEDPDISLPAAHAPFSRPNDSVSDLSTSFANSSSEASRSPRDSESPDTREVVERADKIDSVVSSALRALHALSLSSDDPVVPDSTEPDNCECSERASGSSGDELAPTDVDAEKGDRTPQQRTKPISKKACAFLETEVADIRELVSDAVNRARRNDLLESSGDLEYDKRLQRSRRRVYQLLDIASTRATELREKVDALKRPSGLAASGNTTKGATKRPSKKKAQQAKRNERKARRLREQERAASSNVRTEASTAEPPADGISI